MAELSKKDWADKETLRLAKIPFAYEQEIAINAALRAAYRRGVEDSAKVADKCILASHKDWESFGAVQALAKLVDVNDAIRNLLEIDDGK